MKTTLIIMAAGIGSRFGTGIKQLAKMSDNGEIIMDYSIYDAKEAGFDKVVFVIRKDIEEEFKAVIGNRIGSQIEVEYVYQELTDLPEGFTVPEGRKKPWGTGQAVLACKDVVEEPFVIINADDYYGKEAFVKLHDFLVNGKQEGEVLNMAMAGFVAALLTIIRKLVHPGIPVGWASTICVVTVFAGLILMSLGIIGEYLGKIILTLNHTPQFIVRESINTDGEKR